jgi:hypothetical protein
MHPRLQAELANVDRTLRNACVRVGEARSIREAVQAGQSVHAPAYLRTVLRSQPAYRALQTALTQRLRCLIELQLQRVKILPVDQRKQALCAIETREWIFLRGDHAQELHFAQQEARKILSAAHPAI